MSLLTIIQDACIEVGIAKPVAIVGNVDSNIVQMLGLLNREGKELVKGREGQILPDVQREVSHTTLAAELQGDLEDIADSDYKNIISDSMWNISSTQRVFPIKNEAEWRRRVALTSTSPFPRFRVRLNPTTNKKALYLFPAPAAGQTLEFAYVSKFWCRDAAGGQGLERFVADDDEGIVSEEVLTLGVIWRWKEKKGLDYAEDFRMYENAVKDELSTSMPAPTLSMTGETVGELDYVDPSRANIPEGGW